jgi:hypothetical protein
MALRGFWCHSPKTEKDSKRRGKDSAESTQHTLSRAVVRMISNEGFAVGIDDSRRSIVMLEDGICTWVSCTIATVKQPSSSSIVTSIPSSKRQRQQEEHELVIVKTSCPPDSSFLSRRPGFLHRSGPPDTFHL